MNSVKKKETGENKEFMEVEKKHKWQGRFFPLASGSLGTGSRVKICTFSADGAIS